jgi:DNA repair protein REV1
VNLIDQFDDEEGDEYNGSRFNGFSDYFRRKKIKLQNLDYEIRANSERPPIFRGVVAHVNGYTQPSLNDLHKLIVEHGGAFLQYLDGKTMVTHIIASNLTPKKKVEFRRYRIVQPAWVVESIKAGRLLPWDQFRVIDEGKSQKVIAFDGGKVVSELNNRKDGYKEQTKNSWYTGQLGRDRDSEMTSSNEYGTPIDASAGEIQIASSANNSDTEFESTNPPVAEPDMPKSQGSSFQCSLSDSQLLEASKFTGTAASTDRQRESPPGTPVKHEFSQLNLSGSSVARRSLPSTPSPRRSAKSRPLTPKSPLIYRDYIQGKDLKLEIEEELAQSPFKIPGFPDDRVLTAEEHNSILLSDPKIWKSSVLNPDFIKSYYSTSRLHHLSAWKAQLKAKLQSKVASQNPGSRSRKTNQPRPHRYVLHVDFDSFFAAVSLKSKPEWKTKPVVVAHGNGSGSEIASCNYVAREFGIKNGMWMRKAQELCAEIKVLPYDFDAYEEASEHFYDVISATGGVVQSVSIDEALLDITELCFAAKDDQAKLSSQHDIVQEQELADKIATEIRNRVREKTGCEVSVGIGGNILQAKIALRKAKPAGQYQLKPEAVLEFLENLDVRDLPGVAYNMGAKLEEASITNIKELRNFSKERLSSIMGPKTGEKLWEFARGIDKSEVGADVIRKSVSAEINWGVRFENQAQAEQFMLDLSGELQRRLLDCLVKGKNLTIKIMRRASDAPLDPPKHMGHGKCDTFNKSASFGIATNSQEVIAKEAISILRSFNFPPGELRGIGIQMTKLEPLKYSMEDSQDSSQKKLIFQKQEAPAVQSEDDVDPIIDDDTQVVVKSIEEPVILPAATISTKPNATNRILNTAGTQFLPIKFDIREPDQPDRSFSEFMPNESQLDMDAFAQLPPEIQDEIKADYKRRITRHTPDTVSRSRASPARGVAQKKKQAKGKSVVRSKRGGTTSNSTLTQANFVLSPNPKRFHDGNGETSRSMSPITDLDPSVLAELPEDIRRQVVAEHRQERLRKAQLNVTPKKNRTLGSSRLAGQKHLFALPPKAEKPFFTINHLTTLSDLRDALTVWVNETNAAEGPVDEDVESLARYLWKVVVDEKDMEKATNLVSWLELSVGMLEEEAAEHWKPGLEALKATVGDAVQQRGLGMIPILDVK